MLLVRTQRIYRRENSSAQWKMVIKPMDPWVSIMFSTKPTNGMIMLCIRTTTPGQLPPGIGVGRF